MQFSRLLLFFAGVTATASLFAAEAPVSTPLYFEPNLGQAGDPAQVQFFSRASGALRAYFKPDGVFLLTRGAKVPVRMELTGVAATKTLRFEAEDERQSISAYFIGNDKTKWLPRVPNYGRVRAKDVYPGIDLVFYGSPAGNKLEYDFVVKPGADPKQIEISFSGADVKLTAQGDLNLGGALVQRKAYVHQGKAEVASSYRLVDGARVRLDLGAYDASAELVVDPVVDFFQNVDGNTSFEDFRAVKIDAAGDRYAVGSSDSVDWPVSFPFQFDQPGTDAVVQKYSSSAPFGQLLYSTYLGGSQNDYARSLAVSATGAVYVASNTASPNFPSFGTGSLAHQSSIVFDWCLVVINPFTPSSNISLSYASCFSVTGLNAYDPSVALSPVDGSVHMAGYVIASPAYSRILRIVPGIGMTANTVLGGNRDVFAFDMDIDAAGAVYVGGFTAASNLPVVNAYQTSSVSTETGFVGKLVYSSPSSASWDYLTYLGGTLSSSTVYGLAVTPDGKVAIGGFARSAPTPNGSSRIGSDTYVALLNARSSGPVTLAYGTYPHPSFFLGSPMKSVAVDSKDTVYLAGRDPSSNSAAILKIVRAPSGSAVTAIPLLLGGGDYFYGVATSADRRKVMGGGGYPYNFFNGYGAMLRGWDQSLTATINTTPAGLQVQVDGAPATHGSTQTWIEHEYHTLDASAPITTPAGIGYTFASWADGGTASKSVAPTGNITYTANYTPSSYRLSVGKTGNGTVAGGAINCGTTCSAQIAANTSVTLLATPSAGWTFAGWSGGSCSGTGSCTVSMDAVKAVSATFTQGNGSTTPGGPLLLAITAKSGTVGGVRTWVLTITNQDTVAATMDFGPFTLTQVAGAACNPVVQKAVGTAIGSVASGSSLSTPVPINFAGCPAAARFTVNASVSANGGTKTGSVTLLNQFQ